MKKLVKVLVAMAMGCLFNAPVEAGGVFDKLEIKVDDGDDAFAVNTPLIEVENDGEKWTTIKTSYQSVNMKVNIDVKSGWRIYEAYIGMPTGERFSNNRHRLGGGSGTKKINKNYSHVFATDKIGGIDQISILGLCNANNFPVTKEQNWSTTISVGIRALVGDRYKFFNWQEGRTTVGVGTRSDTASTRIPVRIRCLASPAQIQAPPEPFSVDLQVTQQGETCPRKTEVRAFIKYRVPATARFRFKVDGKLSDLHTIKARKLGGKPRPNLPGDGLTYLVERVNTYYLDPGEHHFRIEVRGGQKSRVITKTIKCPSFKVFPTSFLNYKVQNTFVCPKNVNEVAVFKATRPGTAPFVIKTQGGQIVNSGIATFKRKGREYVAKIKRKFKIGAFESGMSAVVTSRTSSSTANAHLKVECLEYSGDFSFMDNTGTSCPREGKALVNFSMNIKKNIHYTLACSNGNFSGVAKAVPGNNGGFVAPALVKFNINQTTHANCRLSSVVAGQTKNHTLKGHVFKCIKRTNDPVTGDLSGGANPTPGGPTTPDVLVADPETPPVPPAPPVNVVPGIIADPVRTVSCAGGIVRNQKCYCPRTHKKVSAGSYGWRCVRSVVSDPVRTNPTTGGKPGTPGASGGTNTGTGVPTRTNPTSVVPTRTNPTGVTPTRTNPASVAPTRKNPGADKRRLEELKKRQEAQRKAAAKAKRKAAAAAAARRKAAAVAVAKRKAAAAAAARRKAAAAAAARRKAAAAATARRKAAALAATRTNKKSKKKGKKKGRRTIAQ